MANSQRQVILTYLASTLFPTITTGAGYNFTVATYERGLKSVDQMTNSDFPALFVSSADEQRENITHRDFKSVMTVIIHGAVKSSDGVVQVELDKLIEDVTKALSADYTQGGRVAYTDIKSVVTDEGDQHPHAFFRMEVAMLYKSVGTTP